MIAPKCCMCQKELMVGGALLFGAPAVDGFGIVTKRHLCIVCYPKVFDFIQSNIPEDEKPTTVGDVLATAMNRKG